MLDEENHQFQKLNKSEKREKQGINARDISDSTEQKVYHERSITRDIARNVGASKNNYLGP